MYILTRDLLVPVGGQNISRHTKSICASFWVGCVLTANKLVEDSNGIELRPPLLGDLGSLDLFCIRV